MKRRVFGSAMDGAGLEALQAQEAKKTEAAIGPRLTCFSDEAHDASFHFQILCLDKQLYIWIGCNSARLGHLLAAMLTPYDRTPSVSGLLGGAADSPGNGIARRLALKSGWSIVLSTNLPSNSPVLESYAERRLLQELQALGYINASKTKPTLQQSIN